jgi:hypothetical protein
VSDWDVILAVTLLVVAVAVGLGWWALCRVGRE